METILVAVDGSAHADKAVDIAGDLALRHEAKLVIVHVVQPTALSAEARQMAEVEHLADDDAPTSGGLREMPLWLREAMHASDHTAADARVAHRLGQMMLDRAETAARRAGCADVTKIEESGDPVDAIVACANKVQADAVVLGSRGLGGLSEVLLGSVSHGVAHRLPMTCVMVK